MCHSFIIGDLIIDHTIFVDDITNHRQRRENEGIFGVLRRTDTAGGAANSARILAALSPGQTNLWGLIGRSHWGSFRYILEHSQAVDGSANNIQFRGINDEAEAQMNTVTRLILLKDAGGADVFRFGDRFDETGHLHVPPRKRENVLYYLRRAREKLMQEQKGHLNVIIINDFDMGCLTTRVVEKIGGFAQRYAIPLFVNPRYDNKKYRNIEGTAILADLKEWCRLVGVGNHEREWRNRIKKGADLPEMAYRSFRAFGYFEYYVIKCEDAGTVFIGPSPQSKGPSLYSIWKIPTWKAPSSSVTSAPLHQLGASDVMTAVFAMEFHNLVHPEEPPHERSKRALEALTRANAVVGCYRDMPWDRMPTPEFVEQGFERAKEDRKYDLSGKSYIKKSLGTLRKGMMYLPKTADIVLSDNKTIVPDWYSKPRSEFSKSLEELRNDCLSNDLSKHMVLTAPGGNGKSTLLEFLHDEAIRQKQEFELVEGITKKDDMEQRLRALFHKQNNRSPSLTSVLAIDEALGCGFEEVTQARIWLEEAKKHSVRLLLVDANFLAKAQDHNYSDQVIARCHRHVLMTPDQHPRDIPFMIAGIIARKAPDHIVAVDIQGDFLLAFIDAMLEEPTVRVWEEEIKQAVEPVFDNTSNGKPAKLTGASLTKRAKAYLDPYAAPIASESWFKLSMPRE